MQTRSQALGAVNNNPTPAAAAAPPSTTVACPECFQVGEHLEGCVEATSKAAPQSRGSELLPAAEPGQAYPNPQQSSSALADASGMVVNVTWGEENIQPIQFNGFRVGPFSASAIVRPGESVSQVVAKLHSELAHMAEAIRAAKADSFIKALGVVATQVQRSAVAPR